MNGFDMKCVEKARSAKAEEGGESLLRYLPDAAFRGKVFQISVKLNFSLVYYFL